MKRPCFLTLKYYQPTPSLGGGGERGGGQIKKPANALHPQPLSLLWGGALHCACPCAPRPQPPAYTKIYPPTTCLGGGPGGGQMRKASHAPRPTHPHLLWGGGPGVAGGGHRRSASAPARTGHASRERPLLHVWGYLAHKAEHPVMATLYLKLCLYGGYCKARTLAVPGGFLGSYK